METSSGFDWDTVNNTELYQICRRAKLPVLPSYPREKMISLLEGLEEGEPVVHSTDIWRDAIMVFVDDFWIKLQSQLTCPAKSRDPKACYQCEDTQVYSCLIENSSAEQFIQLRRKDK